MRSKVMLGMLSGALVAFGISMIVWFALFPVFSHHMFIIGITWPAGYIACSIPFLLVGAGIVIAIRALTR